MTQIHVRPARHDLRVPTGAPGNEYFPTDRATEVERTRYIDRRIADGDLIEEVTGVPDTSGKKGVKE